MPGLSGMAVVVVTSADERLPRISRLRPSTTLASEKPCWPGAGGGGGRVVDDRADRHERADQQ